MADIFISYSRKDKNFIYIFASNMDTFGEGIYWYDKDIRGGDDWAETIEKEIKKCKILLFLVSDESIKSEWCLKELRFAFKYNKRILPTLIPSFTGKYNSCFPADLQKKMSKIQYEDIKNSYDRLPNIFKTLREYLSIFERDVDLTLQERWILFNQFHLMHKLSDTMRELNENYADDYDPNFYEWSKEILQNGYKWYYNWISNHIETEEFSTDASQEIMDILSMFRSLGDSYREVGDESGINTTYLNFRGFDSNNEIEQMIFTRFSMEKMNVYEDLKPQSYKSYSPMLPVYRLMYKEWQQSKDIYNLSKEDLIRITNAWSNRDKS